MALAFYSTATGRLRRATRNSSGESFSNKHLENNNLAAFGETRIRIRDNLDISGIETEVLKRSGITPANDRYAVVNSNGDVVNIIIADPLCNDSVENHILVENPDARIGWRQMRDGTFQRTLEEIEHDISAQESKRDRIVLTNSRTQEEADAIEAQNLIEATAALIFLEEEKTARLLSR